ncbi:MAG TPA: deoxyribose-phosphate aldolase, partial [Nitrososphaerales archaeon]|nr:deoxyribose-phosphate aldolase [Nitrososphaerales archaeon]
TVVGFPLGYSAPAIKREEARRAVQDGADEIDMVMNIGAFKGGELSTVRKEIDGVAGVCRTGGKILKVIIECCYLTDDEKAKAARLAERLGADYVKTSTGFGPSGATVDDVALLHRSLAGTAKVKASGGISTLDKALDMIQAGADRIGTSSSVGIMDELARRSRARRVKKR